MKIKKIYEYINTCLCEEVNLSIKEHIYCNGVEYEIEKISDYEVNKINEFMKELGIIYSKYIIYDDAIYFQVNKIHENYLAKNDDDFFFLLTNDLSYKCDGLDGLFQLFKDKLFCFCDESVLTYKKYSESISGTELVGSIGPNYGEQKLPISLSRSATDLIFMNGHIYTNDEYDSIYQEYLTRGGSPLFGFNRKNLEAVLLKIN